MYLKTVNINEFEEKIYPEYKKIFPKIERKTLEHIKQTYCKHLTTIIEIIEEEQFIGFFIINTLKDNPYILLDYFAILPQYQSRGFGSTAIKLLKNMYQMYDGIYIEIEKVGNGVNEEQNKIREKRAKFYENLGFCKMNFEVELFTVLFSTYILPCSKNTFHEELVIKDIFLIYKAILGEKVMKQNYKLIK